MSETRRQPDNEQPKITFELPSGRIEARPENSAGYLHPKPLRHFDHIYVQAGTEDEPRGAYMFRETLHNFDEVIGYMMHNGFRVVRSKQVDPQDREVYGQIMGRETSPPAEVTKPNMKTYELTPRQERRVLYLGHLLEHGHLTPADFAGSGELEL